MNLLKRSFAILCGLSICFTGSAQYFKKEAPDIKYLSGFKGSELCQVASHTAQYLQKNKTDHFAVHAGSVFSHEITLKQVTKTLQFICQVYREDVRAKRQSRLHNPQFIKANFTFYRWYPDKLTANAITVKSTNKIKNRLLNNIPPDKIFLTKYYTKLLDGSRIQTDHYSQALYSIPFDEKQLSLQQAETQKEKLNRFKYTRQQVMTGILHKQKVAKPIVWITPEALHDVLLQGTGVLNVDGKTRYFNVHRNNGIAYDYSLGKSEQARYWYFSEVPSIMGYGENLHDKIAIKPHVTFAGNVKQLGLGKLFMVSYQTNNQEETRLGVLADQGGAFDNNLFQLDLLVDSYQGWSDYHQANKHLPDYAKAWLVIAK